MLSETSNKDDRKITLDQALELGLASHRQGNFAQARSIYTKILSRQPNNHQALHYLGSLSLTSDQPRKAAELITRSLDICEENSGAHSDLGFAFFQMGLLKKAKISFERSIEIDPKFAQPYCNLATVYKAENKLAKSEEVFNQAIVLDPNLAQAYSNLAGVLIDLGRPEEAIPHCRKAIELVPQYCEAYTNLGIAYKDIYKFDEAVAACLEAIRLDENYAPGYANLGAVYAKASNYDDAEKANDKALEIDPNFADAHYNLGNVYFSQDRIDDAIASFEKALEIQKDFADAHLSLGRIYLKRGDLAGFWTVYERRWDSKSYRSFKRIFPQPIWGGAATIEKEILIWGEQGIGDEIFFAGLIPEVIRQSRQVWIECEQRLLPLFERSFPKAKVFARDFERDIKDVFEKIDFQIPSGSLGRWMRPSFSDFKSLGTYLVADQDLVREIRNKYSDLSPGPKIGISWSSRPPKQAPLELWGPIFNIPGAVFVNLQYGNCQDELAEAEASFGISIVDDSEIDPLVDMDLFAAQIDALDAVVTIDNSTLAVAVGLGKPVFALLSKTAEWRYNKQDGKNPWHDTLKTYRQTVHGEWDEPIKSLSENLADYLA